MNRILVAALMISGACSDPQAGDLVAGSDTALAMGTAPIRHDAGADPDAPPPAVDLVLIVDNTASMWDEQVRLAEAIPDALAAWAVTDWTATVITTDNSTVVFATDNVPGAAVDLQRAVQVGTGGHWVVTARHSLAVLLNSGHLREDAVLAVLIISDGEDTSTETVDDLALALGSRAVVSTLVIHEGCGWGDIGWQHMELAERTGGTPDSICTPDFGPTISEHLAIAANIFER